MQLRWKMGDGYLRGWWKDGVEDAKDGDVEKCEPVVYLGKTRKDLRPGEGRRSHLFPLLEAAGSQLGKVVISLASHPDTAISWAPYCAPVLRRFKLSFWDPLPFTSPN